MTDDRSAVPGGPEELDATATGIDTTVPHSAQGFVKVGVTVRD